MWTGIVKKTGSDLGLVEVEGRRSRSKVEVEGQRSNRAEFGERSTQNTSSLVV